MYLIYTSDQQVQIEANAIAVDSLLDLIYAQNSGAEAEEITKLQDQLAQQNALAEEYERLQKLNADLLSKKSDEVLGIRDKEIAELKQKLTQYDDIQAKSEKDASEKLKQKESENSGLRNKQEELERQLEDVMRENAELKFNQQQSVSL